MRMQDGVRERCKKEEESRWEKESNKYEVGRGGAKEGGRGYGGRKVVKGDRQG